MHRCWMSRLGLEWCRIVSRRQRIGHQMIGHPMIGHCRTGSHRIGSCRCRIGHHRIDCCMRGCHRLIVAFSEWSSRMSHREITSTAWCCKWYLVQCRHLQFTIASWCAGDCQFICRGGHGQTCMSLTVYKIMLLYVVVVAMCALCCCVANCPPCWLSCIVWVSCCYHCCCCINMRVVLVDALMKWWLNRLYFRIVGCQMFSYTFSDMCLLCNWRRRFVSLLNINFSVEDGGGEYQKER